MGATGDADAPGSTENGLSNLTVRSAKVIAGATAAFVLVVGEAPDDPVDDPPDEAVPLLVDPVADDVADEPLAVAVGVPVPVAVAVAFEVGVAGVLDEWAAEGLGRSSGGASEPQAARRATTVAMAQKRPGPTRCCRCEALPVAHEPVAGVVVCM